MGYARSQSFGPRLLFLISVLVMLGFAVSQTTLTVQFAGSGDQMTLEEASALASVDLAQDTSLTSEDIANFSAIGENDFAGCFATSMVDLQTQLVLGTGIDCLRVTSVEGGAQLQALSIFVFPEGSLVTLGLTSVRPFIEGVGDAGGALTHMTGYGPADELGVIGGTGAFSDATGSARVSGAVNLGDFPNSMFFDCLWVLEIDRG
jgi:hypothetical protein